MPRYTTKNRRRQQRNRKRVATTLPKGTRKLSRWAMTGQRKDYERLRKLADTAAESDEMPEYISRAAMEQVRTMDRRKLLLGIGSAIDYDVPAFNEQSEQMRRERGRGVRKPWGGAKWHGVTDALSWLLDKANPKGWDWIAGLGQYALKPFRGENLNEVDELYARLVSKGYPTPESRVASFEDYERQVQYDGKYVSVWDDPDGHRLIVVRGTVPTDPADLKLDGEIGFKGRISGDPVGEELRRIIDETGMDKHIDIAGHSLGTVLIVTAFENNRELQRRVHETFLFNPAYNPLTAVGSEHDSILKHYEKDQRIRYFINLNDPVSIGDASSRGPVNVVYRSAITTGGGMGTHKLTQWQGSAPQEEPAAPAAPDVDMPEQRAPESPKENNQNDDAEDSGVLFGAGALDFGSDTFLDEFRRRFG